MTTVTIYKSKSGGSYKRFTCSGHSGYAKAGSDIICASISVLVINTINSMEQLAGEKLDLTTDEDTGFIDCVFSNGINDSSRLLMDAMILGLNDIAAQCDRKYLRLRFKEV